MSLIDFLKKYLIGKIRSKSVYRSIIFTVGHFFIDLTVSYIITGAKLELIAISSLISPVVNGVWYYCLDKLFFAKYIDKTL